MCRNQSEFRGLYGKQHCVVVLFVVVRAKTTPLHLLVKINESLNGDGISESAETSGMEETIGMNYAHAKLRAHQ